MGFTKDSDNLRGLGRQYQRIARDLDGWERTMRPYRQILETQKQMMGGFESPIARTMRDVQAATSALGGQHSIMQAVADAAKPTSGLQQMVADQVTSLDLAKTWGISSVAADVARSFSTVDAYQGLAARIVEQQQQAFQGLAKTMVEQNLRPLQSLAASVAAAGLPQEVTRDGWRPVLMRGFQVPTFTAMSQIATAVDAYHGTLAKAALLNTTSAMDGLRESQARQARDIIRAMRGTAGASSAWQKLSEIDNSYSLRGAWVAPITPERWAPERRSPIIQPEPFTATSPAEAPPAETLPTNERDAKVPDALEDTPYQLIGRWQVLQPLQPVENVLYGILHGPLVVKILAMGVGQLVVIVIGGGIVYFLFYCC